MNLKLIKKSIVSILLILFVLPVFGAEISGNIRLNSVGFKPEMAKFATVSGKCSEFTVKSAADNKAVYNGKASAPVFDKETAEDLCTLDFSELKTPGTYYIEAVPAGRSCNFVISENVFDSAFKASVMGMYLWRCGTAVSAVYNGNIFAAEECHTDDAYLDFVGGTGKKDGTGGWHDAGDYGKYTVNAGITVGLMLKAWEQFGDTIKRVKLNIPESGRAIPDYLAEIKYETDWLLKMQADDGSVYHKISTLSFPGAVMPDKDRARRYFVPWSSAATADFAAVLAAMAKNIKPYDTAAAENYISAAENAARFLKANPDNHKSDQKGFSTGAYDTGDSDDRLWMYAELWDATGKNEYLKEFEKAAAQYPSKFDTDWDWPNVKNLGMLTYLFSKREGKDNTLIDDMKKQLIACADSITKTASENPYARGLGTSYYWGCNGSVARQPLILQSANLIKPDSAYLKTAADSVAHIFGRNYYGRSYVTGIGHNPPSDPHDRRSMADNQKEPWPGYLVGGGHDAKGWKDEYGSFATNEIAINWNASLIYALAGFLYDGPEYTPTATMTGTPPTATPTFTPVPKDLIYDGDTKGRRIKDGTEGEPEGIMDFNGGVKGKALRMHFLGNNEEAQKVWRLKKPVSPEGFNYVEFDVKAVKGTMPELYFSLSMGASSDMLLNVNEYCEKPISANWTKARFPIEEMMVSGDKYISELMWIGIADKITVILIDNIKLINYTPPTPTISQTHSVTPFVTATPSATITPTGTVTPFVTSTPTETTTPTCTATPTITVTSTATPETGVKITIDNSSNSGSKNLLGYIWYTYDDKSNSGTSEIWPKPGSNFEKSGSGKDNKGKAAVMKGKVTTMFQWGYIGMGTKLAADGQTINVTKCGGVRFWHKGDGKKYRVKLVSAHPDFKQGDGDNHLGVEFETSGEWQLFDMPVYSFVKEPYWGSFVEPDDALSMVKEIQWQTREQPHQSIELMIDGVEIYGCEK